MSYHVVLTTACDHSFHAACLGRWSDAPCPVCRYLHASLASQATHCATCALGSEEQAGRTGDLWVCVVCGFAAAPAAIPLHHHIRDHYDQRSTPTPVSVTSQLVWDFLDGTTCIGWSWTAKVSIVDAGAPKLEGLALEYTQSCGRS